ncbi:Trans-aconitate 2-methyltransferase [Rubripirellula amarantea]|uniref:Trans-aconitate 2-methyltransferase n=1 Tax=Rubripirellula amarantea TaxID=2527999 RepID=A0A5C5WGV4_9BACT|nr:class I SAM-dependent methyltransferase [Rubripirellula amarantea]TWT49233.1 Trans-aconitate 2-methyltransferase [Rubripirellula amarantea]
MRNLIGYDRLASVYAILEWLMFGRDLQCARVALLDKIPSANQVLILGDGDGRLLTELLIHFPRAKVLSVDQSSAMLKRQDHSVSLVKAIDRIEFCCVDATTFKPERGKYDLLVLPFFLDCFDAPTLTTCLPNWLSGLNDDGAVYLVDFVQPESGYARWRGKLLLWIMHAFFQIATDLQHRELADLPDLLATLGWQQTERIDRNNGLVTSRLYVRSSST